MTYFLELHSANTLRNNQTLLAVQTIMSYQISTIKLELQYNELCKGVSTIKLEYQTIMKIEYEPGFQGRLNLKLD
jgi:hypothetical protein